MKWLAILLFLPIAFFLLPSTIVLCFSLFPSLIVYLIDSSQRRYMSITIFFFNLAGSAYFLNILWSRGHALNDISPALSDQTGWLFCFIGVALGWMMFIMLPMIWGQVCRAQSALLILRLKREQKRLADLWGADIAKKP